MTTPSPLDESTRCVLALRGPRGPIVSPMAFWWDGGAVWMTSSTRAVKVRRLAADPTCTIYVPGAEAEADGVVVRGRARVYTLGDPLPLALHWPVVSTAMGALAARNVPTLVGYARDAPKVPWGWDPAHRVALCVAADEVDSVASPPVARGIVPGLPTTIPADVRRALAGRRRVVLATEGLTLDLVPAVLGAGNRVNVADGVDLPARARAAAVLDDDPGGRPTQVLGVALRGPLADGVLTAERATWWHGFKLETVDAPTATTRGGIEIPE